MTLTPESLFEDINHFINGTVSGLLQLLVAAARRTTYNRIVECPRYPTAVRAAGLSLAVEKFLEATTRSDIHTPTFIARLYASTRDLEHRKRLGQFFTSEAVADWALTVEPPRTNEDILDAGAGAAVFAHTIVRRGLRVRSYIGVENDAVLALCAAHVLEAVDAPVSFKIWYSNFLLLQDTSFDRLGLKRPSLVLANPPFIRSQKLVGRERLLTSIKSKFGITLSHMSGSGAYFLARAASLVQSNKLNGNLAPRLLFFFPKEAAGSAHARKLRQSLQNIYGWAFQEHHIPVYQTGVDKHPSNALALFFAFDRQKVKGEPIFHSSEPGLCVGDFLHVKRGISTGRNEFFVLTEVEARQRQIPQQYLRAVLPTRINIPGTSFSKSYWSELRRSGHRCWLLALPNTDLANFEISVRDYLKEGLRRGLNSTPTAQRLRNWFSLPLPETPPDVFVTYLFRGSPRFILNDAKVLHLTNILGGRFAPSIKGPDAQKAVVNALNEQGKSWMRTHMPGREYRGGLMKIEPRELAKLSVESQVLDSIKFDRRIASASLFE